MTLSAGEPGHESSRGRPNRRISLSVAPAATWALTASHWQSRDTQAGISLGPEPRRAAGGRRPQAGDAASESESRAESRSESRMMPA